MAPFDKLPFDEQLQIDALCQEWESSLMADRTVPIDDLLQHLALPEASRVRRVELLLTQLDLLSAQAISNNAQPLGAPDFVLFLENAYQEHLELQQHPDDFGNLVARAFHGSQQYEPNPQVSDYVQRFAHVEGVEHFVRRLLTED